MDAEIVIKQVFEKYAAENSGRLLLPNFCKMMTRLSSFITMLQHVHSSLYPALFCLIDKNGKGVVNLTDFEIWWNSTNRLSYVIGNTGKLLKRIHVLFISILSESSSSSFHRNVNSLTTGQFETLVEKLGVKPNDSLFDVIDTNEDGKVSFYELCKWLKWFEIYF